LICLAASAVAQAPPARRPPSQAAAPAGPPAAVLQALDKVTGRVRTIEAAIDRPVQFGSLEIVVRTCRKRPPEETPESTAFLEITDARAPEPGATVFSGWMFASSPAISALEHPVYDVWVLDCKGDVEPLPAVTPR
jgi:hypothetical protein